MSAIEGVSEIFDPEAWDMVPGFDDLSDLTYHRAREHGTVRIAFDRPDVLNAFRPHTVDERAQQLVDRAGAEGVEHVGPVEGDADRAVVTRAVVCLLYTSPSPRDS